MPFMRSNKRQRARARLATSKPVNMMFSNGLGVCKIPNAGSRSICRRKTRVATAPGAFATGYVKPFNDTTDTDKNLLNFKTNIKGATITLVGDIGGLENQALIDTTGNITVDNTKQYTIRKFKSGITSLSNGITVTNVKLTLTGGKINPSGGWNINNVSHTVKIPDFTIDTDTPSVNNIETTYDGTTIIVTFDESITSNGSLNKGDYALSRPSLSEEISSVQIIGGKLHIVPKIPIVAAEALTCTYTVPVGSPGALQDAAGNLVVSFTQVITSTVGVVPAAVPGAAGPPVTGSRVNYPNTNQILLEFTKPISSSLSGPLDKTDFAIVGVNSGATVTSVQITSGKVLLTLSGVIVQSDTAITVTYTGVANGTTVLKSTDNLIAPDFTNLSVYNNIPALAPKNATFDDTTITIEYNRPVEVPAFFANLLASFAYSVRKTDGNIVSNPTTPSAFEFVNGKLILTRNDNVLPAETAFIAFTYTAPGPANELIKDDDGNVLGNITLQAATGPVPRSLEAVCDTTATPYMITLTYSGIIAENTNLLGKFTSSGIINNPTITDVTVTSDGKVELSFSAVIAGVPVIQYNDVGNANEMKTTSGVPFIDNICAGFGAQTNVDLANQGQPLVTLL